MFLRGRSPSGATNEVAGGNDRCQPKAVEPDATALRQHLRNIVALEKAFETGRLDATQPLDEAKLREAGVVRSGGKFAGVRLLAQGEITRPINITVSGASKAAVAAVQAAGGTITLLVPPKEQGEGAAPSE